MGRLRIVTWNAEGMFAPVTAKMTRTRRATEHDAVRTVEALNADIIMIPEFGEYGVLDQAIRAAINSLGYEIIETPYEEQGDPTPRAMAMLSRLPVLSQKIYRFGEFRNASVVVVDDNGKKIRVVGVHLDDVREETRLRQAEDLIEFVASDKKSPTFVLGDFNAMNRRSVLARILNNTLLDTPIKRVSPKKLTGISERLQGMASGTTIERIEQSTNLINLDPGHHLTISGKRMGMEWVPAIRLAKIDWIFGTHHFKVTRYRIYKDVGSDHRPVIADVEI